MKPPRLPDRVWVLVAHEAGARIFFRDDPRTEFQVIEKIDWPVGRAKSREITSERPGHEESWGPSKQRHGFDQRVSEPDKNALTLARKITHRLDQASGLDEYDHLLVVAGPKFLGMLRKEMGRATLERLVLTLNENLAEVEDKDMTLRLGLFLENYERIKALMKAG